MGNHNTAGLPALLQPPCNLLGNIAPTTYLGVAPHTLDAQRCTIPPSIQYIRAERLMKYRQAGLDTWLTAKTVGAAA